MFPRVNYSAGLGRCAVWAVLVEARMLLHQIAVPEVYQKPQEVCNRYLMEMCREAGRIAAEYCRKKKLPFSLERHLAMYDKVEEEVFPNEGGAG